MNTIARTIIGSLALFALQAVIVVTPALAAEPAVSTPQVMPWGTIIMPPVRIVSKPCKVRELDQGSGAVRICG